MRFTNHLKTNIVTLLNLNNIRPKGLYGDFYVETNDKFIMGDIEVSRSISDKSAIRIMQDEDLIVLTKEEALKLKSVIEQFYQGN